MNEAVFFDDPMILFRKDRVMDLWPSPRDNLNVRINASARFIVFVTCGLYLYTRDVRVFSLCLLFLGVLYYIYNSSDKNSFSINPDCHLPTPDNPMSNFLQNEYNTQRKPACDYQDVKPLVKDVFDDRFIVGNSRSRAPMPEQQKYAAARQWVMNPARDNPNSQTEFAEFCYGNKSQPTCRDSPEMCDPNARGAQLEAFAGLDPAGMGRYHGGGSIKYS